MSRSLIQAVLVAHQEASQRFITEHADDIDQLGKALARVFERGGKLLVCGNGGSACDAMHIAGEFVGRFVNDRRAFPAIALSADSGAVTAIANDYGYDRVFARQVEAYGREGDMLIALSTSGSSPSILAALEVARSLKMATALLTGEKGRKQTAHADRLLVVPAHETARIQEVHILCLHLLAALVEAELPDTTSP